MTQQEHVLIVGRFFEALAWLEETRQIRGLKTFTDRYGINRRSLRRVQGSPETRSLKAAWLSFLVRDYGISAAWLLTGEGPMHD
jgi:hypothetical protein